MKVPDDKIILLVEDNADDVQLTLRSLRKNNILNEVIVARDGVEALDYLFGRGAYAERDLNCLPVVVLLDIKLPKIDGIEVLRQLRQDERTRLLPVVILTSSKEDSDLMNGYRLGPTATCASRSISSSSTKPSGTSGCTGCSGTKRLRCPRNRPPWPIRYAFSWSKIPKATPCSSSAG